ncbi:TIGR04222 domain-containing membrane protein [Streptomyces sp. NPDC008125]|uniref:TIGR04222 domain-containing membrane protein n=1 Tax=Streptomyces sp. NPDC008125 TaxID=3364811 RepID=UPI0036E5AC48
MNLIALLLTLGIVVSGVLLLSARARSGPRGAASGAAVYDDHEAAFLGGGPARVVDTALTALHTDGRVVIGGPGIVSVLRPYAQDPVERAVLHELALAPSGALHLLRLAVMRHPAVQEIGDGLAARGLLARPEELRRRRRWGGIQSVVSLVLFPVSMIATFVQYAALDGYAGMPFPFVVKMLPAIFFGGVTGLVVAVGARARITRAGVAAVGAYRAARAAGGSPAQLVAAYGVRASADPALRNQLTAAARYRSPGQGRRGGSSPAHPYGGDATGVAGAAMVPVVWCAGAGPGAGCGSGSGSGSASSCGGSGSGCGGGGSSCGGSGSGCGSGSSSCGGGGSSCGSSSSSCGGGGSSCGGGSS